MTSPTSVDRLYDDITAILKQLQEVRELSLHATASESLAKTLVIAAASHFEKTLCAKLVQLVDELSNHQTLLVSFVERKAIKRQYHTYFDWDSRKANMFFSLFGDEFASHMRRTVESEQDLEEAIVAFLQLGRDRNTLAHNDLAGCPLNSTPDDVYLLYKRATVFVDRFEQLAKGFAAQRETGRAASV